nr:hypothetical protein HK105_006115 [Polyrhizophydium stewartii]
MNGTTPCTTPGQHTGARDLGWENVGIASLLLLVNGALSLYFGLGLETSIAVAAVRCVVQLSILGYVLKPVFEMDSPLLVLAMALALAIIAVCEVVWARTPYRHNLMFVTVFVSILGSTMLVAFLGNAYAIRAEPWYSPREFIPTLGMTLGNSMSSIAVGLSSVMTQLVVQKDSIEMYLAFGASRWEAARPVCIEAIKIAMLPAINSMSIIGLISIPGMMTGQILGGSSVENAARYQQIISFMITASCGLSTVCAVLAAAFIVVDDKARLRADRLVKNDRKKVNQLQRLRAWLGGMRKIPQNKLAAHLRTCKGAQSSKPSATDLFNDAEYHRLSPGGGKGQPPASAPVLRGSTQGMMDPIGDNFAAEEGYEESLDDGLNQYDRSHAASRHDGAGLDGDGDMEPDTVQDDMLDEYDTEPREMTPCHICGRKFLAERMVRYTTVPYPVKERHLVACSKAHKARKVFDMSSARIKGTDLEKYASKGGRAGGRAGTSTDKPPKKSNWRAKHEAFVQMVRAAREPAGAPGSSRAAAPAVDPNPDYVTCPTCNRRFNEDSGARHMPLCKEKHAQQASRISNSRGAQNGKEDMLKRRTAYKPPPPKTGSSSKPTSRR